MRDEIREVMEYAAYGLGYSGWWGFANSDKDSFYFKEDSTLYRVTVEKVDG